MFREMRRKKQVLPIEECAAVLRRGSSGVLAVLGDGGYPYAVPLSYVYDGKKIYFHCAKTGHKLDAIRRESKVSFCVIDLDQVLPEKYTTCYRSVIVFGRARILEDEAEKRLALERLAAKYSPEQTEGRRLEIEKELDAVCMAEIQIEHLTGKEGLELLRQREKNGN